MKQRIITAIIMIIIALPFALIGGTLFNIGISLLSIFGLYELIKLKNKDNHLPLLMKIISYLLVGVLTINNIFTSVYSYMLDYRICYLIILLLTIPMIFYDKKKYNVSDALFLIGAVFFLGIAFNQFVVVRNVGLGLFIFLISITIFTDTFAYFTGLLIGKHKMCPKISPKKTWEGFVGGLLLGTFISTSIYLVSFSNSLNIFLVILIVALLSTIGQMGDLVFSSIKRYYDVKDYSNLLPGHGGILDRVDSILFVLLAFSFVSTYLI